MSSDWNKKLCCRTRTCQKWSWCVVAVTLLGMLSFAGAYTWPETWRMWIFPAGLLWLGVFIAWVATVPHSHID